MVLQLTGFNYYTHMYMQLYFRVLGGQLIILGVRTDEDMVEWRVVIVDHHQPPVAEHKCPTCCAGQLRSVLSEDCLVPPSHSVLVC